MELKQREDGFVVFVRAGRDDPERQDTSERAFTTCSTYAQAKRIRRGLQRIQRDCVIRYDGETGGSD